MRYRTVFRNGKVIACVQDTSNTVTSSDSDFTIQTPQEAIKSLLKEGIDPSYIWREGYAPPRGPVRGQTIELDITPHPQYSQLQRKAFVISLTYDLSSPEAVFTVLIRHFYQNTLINGRINDIIPNLPPAIESLDLSFYDAVYVDRISSENAIFNSLESSDTTLLQMQDRVRSLDAAGRFNGIY